MTANDIYNSALIIAGFADCENIDGSFLSPGGTPLLTVNRALSELNTAVASTLNQELSISGALADAVVFGTARLIAASRHDTVILNDLTEQYNRFRARALAGTTQKRESLPCLEV